MSSSRSRECAPGLRAPVESQSAAYQELIGVHVDYSDNHKLFEMVYADSFHASDVLADARKRMGDVRLRVARR